jgi:hypothetical protein
MSPGIPVANQTVVSCLRRNLASYEAGSFKALSNIEDVLERMSTLVSSIHHEELTRRVSVKDYADELKIYRQWATEFANN